MILRSCWNDLRLLLTGQIHVEVCWNLACLLKVLNQRMCHERIESEV